MSVPEYGTVVHSDVRIQRMLTEREAEKDPDRSLFACFGQSRSENFVCSVFERGVLLPLKSLVVGEGFCRLLVVDALDEGMLRPNVGV